MRHALRRMAFGVLGVGMLATMATGASTVAASAAVAAPHASSTASHPYLIWPVVRRGDFGIRVRTVQYLLDQHGAHLVPNGVFGSATEHAVRHFQLHHGLIPDGVVGQATWPRLVVTVRHGSRGPAVAGAQDQLRHYGYFFVHIDGFFGHKTEIAVHKFQYRFRIVSDGIVGTGTWWTFVTYDYHV
jgi:peptidoglycan hydrolase-like protein with peptidoglycan-binding domain